MRVKFLRSVGRKDTLPRTNDHPTSLELPAKPDGAMYQENETADLPDEAAERCLAAKVAEVVAAAKAQPQGGK